MRKTYGTEDCVCLEDDDCEYEIDWEGEQLTVSVRDKKTGKVIFDGSFDTVAQRFV